LRYQSLEEDHDTPEQIAYDIALATTSQQYGGVRWWLRCPLAVNGEPCRRCVRQLYLPPGKRYFGCRYCYNLTYESRRDP
jgi:hypothetical protein